MSTMPVELSCACQSQGATSHCRHAGMAICQQDLSLRLLKLWSLQKHPISSSGLIEFTQAKPCPESPKNLPTLASTCLHRQGTTSHRRHAGMAFCQQNLALRLLKLYPLRTHPTTPSRFISFTQEVLVPESLNCLTSPPRHHLLSPSCLKDLIPASPFPVFVHVISF